MAVFLEVRSGSQTGTRIRLNPGQLVRIGRTKASDFAFADDSHMSGAHFTVEAADTGCHLSDLNSRNGLFLNGQRVSTSALANGDTVVAGETKPGFQTPSLVFGSDFILQFKGARREELNA